MSFNGLTIYISVWSTKMVMMTMMTMRMMGSMHDDNYEEAKKHKRLVWCCCWCPSSLGSKQCIIIREIPQHVHKMGSQHFPTSTQHCPPAKFHRKVQLDPSTSRQRWDSQTYWQQIGQYTPHLKGVFVGHLTGLLGFLYRGSRCLVKGNIGCECTFPCFFDGKLPYIV